MPVETAARETVEQAAAATEATPKRNLDEKVVSFNKQETQSMFPDGKEREQLEHNYGFSRQTIEEYSAVLENRLETIGG